MIRVPPRSPQSRSSAASDVYKRQAQRGVLSPGFPSIISSGKNNFKIHYYDYRGQAQDGDMILNDVGAVWDYEINDVSRAFPCNGRFNDRQKLLYECIYNTSEYMFSTCLLYTSDAADDLLCVDLGGTRIIKKKKIKNERV